MPPKRTPSLLDQEVMDAYMSIILSLIEQYPALDRALKAKRQKRPTARWR